MRWMIAAAFLIQPASACLAAQETNTVSLETLPHNEVISAGVVQAQPPQGGIVATGQQPITDQDLASFLNEDPEPLPQPGVATAGADSMLWKLVAVLCGVLLLCAIIAVRHGHAKAGLTNPGPGQLSLIASLPLANRSALHLVSASGSMLVVASDSSGVKSVTRLPEQFDDLIDAAQQPYAESEVGHV